MSGWINDGDGNYSKPTARIFPKHRDDGFMNLDPLTVAKLEIYRLQEENKQLKEKVGRYKKALFNTYVEGMTIEEILKESDKWVK